MKTQKRKLSVPADSSPSKLAKSSERRHSEEHDLEASTERMISKRRSVHSSSSTNSQQSNQKELKKRQVKKYCLCQTPYNRDQFYIQCDACDECTRFLILGYHGKCVMLSENLGEQIEKWFCPLCVKEKDLELKWKPDCTREDCKERIRTESLYCSEDCGIMVTKAKLQSLLPSITPLYKTIGTDLYRREELKALAQVTMSRKNREREIRFLEKRQILIDEAIEVSRNLNASRDLKICGFDDRICTKWIPSNTQFYDSFDKEVIDDDVEMDVTTASEDEQLLCQNVMGKCIFHDGWEYLKSKDVAMELHEQIKQYCLEKQKEVDLALRLLDLRSVLALGKDLNLEAFDSVDIFPSLADESVAADFVEDHLNGKEDKKGDGVEQQEDTEAVNTVA